MPDYAQLAAELGGTPAQATPTTDYASLAKELGGKPLAQAEEETGGGSSLLPTAVGATSMAAARSAPAVVSSVNAAARAGRGLAATRMGRFTPAVIATDAAMRAARGDVKGAATSAATAAAATQVPRALGVIERATAPSVGLIRGESGRFAVGSGRAAPLARGASTVSRAAGRASLPGIVVSSLFESGHAPAMSPLEKLERGMPLNEIELQWIRDFATQETDKRLQ